jgi:hypothetical protein
MCDVGLPCGKLDCPFNTQECGRDSAHRIAEWFETEEARPSGYYRYDYSMIYDNCYRSDRWPPVADSVHQYGKRCRSD